MARSTWLPGRNQRREPGRDHDGSGFGISGPGQTPLEDLLTGAVFCAVALGGIAVGFVSGVGSNLGAVAIMLGAGTIFLAGGVYMIVRGEKRRRWRLREARRTGQPFVRAWQRTPSPWTNRLGGGS